MLTSRIPRGRAERRRYPTVTFTDAFGDTTTGMFLGVDTGPRQPVRILVGGRIEKRATRDRSGADRTFDLVIA